MCFLLPGHVPTGQIFPWMKCFNVFQLFHALNFFYSLAITCHIMIYYGLVFHKKGQKMTKVEQKNPHITYITLYDSAHFPSFFGQ